MSIEFAVCDDREPRGHYYDREPDHDSCKGEQAMVYDPDRHEHVKAPCTCACSKPFTRNEIAKLRKMMAALGSM